MGKKYEKLTIKVSPQTAYHLDQISRAEQCSIGRVIDKLIRDRMRAARPQTTHAVRYFDGDGIVLYKGGVRD